MNRLLPFLLILPLVAQAEEPNEVRAALEQAASDPDGALARLEALTRTGPPERTREAARARAGLLVKLGRAAEGEAAWRLLLARGDALAPAALLAQAGARLEAAPASPPRPGRPAVVRLAGAATGPLQLRLYAVDAPRWRLEKDARSAFERLRAPSTGLLRGLAAWEHEGFGAGGGEVEVTTPPLEGGLHLLVVEARGVALPVPLTCTRARAVARDGLLWLVDAAGGAPLAGVELRTLDVEGKGGGPLGSTDQDGLLRHPPGPAFASGWLGDEPLLFPLPPPPTTGPPAPPVCERDLARAVPGGRLHLLFPDLPPGRTLPWALRAPGGATLERGELQVGAEGTALLPLAVPRAAPAGEWQLALVESRLAALSLPVVEAPSPLAALELTTPAAPVLAAGAPIPLALRARLADGRPLTGRRVTWELRLHPAAPESRAGTPLPLHALRLLPAPPELLARGELLLDAGGAAGWEVPAPALAGPSVLSLSAELPLEGEVRLSERRVFAAAPHPIHLTLRLLRASVAPGRLVEARVTALGPDGAPIPDLDLELRAAPLEGGEPIAQALRTLREGTATAFFNPDQAGPWRVVARAAGHPEATAALLVVGGDGSGAPREGPPALLLEGPLEPGARAELLLLVPGAADGPALLLAGERTVRLELMGGAARTSIDVPATPLRVTALAVRGDALLEAGLELAPAVAPLRVQGRVAGWPGDQMELVLEARGPLGGPVPALLSAVLFTGPEAELAARQPPPSLPPRATGSVAVVGSGGEVRLRLPRPDRPGWVRVRAIGAGGATGEAWVAVGEPAPLRVGLHGPSWLASGDRGELRAVVELGQPAALLPGTTLRLSWGADGVELGRPRVSGAALLPAADAGPDELCLEPGARIELVFPLSATRPGPARATVSAALQGSAALPAAAERELFVREPGWTAVRATAGEIAPGGKPARLQLDAPKGAIPRTARLRVAFDPEPATAVLAGQDELVRAPGLRAALGSRWIERAALGPLLRARRLAPRRAPSPAPPRAELLGQLLRARDPAGGWGLETAALTGLLLELRAAGEEVPDELLDPALLALAGRPGDAEAVRLLRRLGRAALVDPPAAATDLLDAAAALAAKEPGRAAVLRAAARERANELPRTRDRALLLLLGLRAGEPAGVAPVASLLLARRGPGWDDPEDAAFALAALGAAAAAEPERPGTRLRVRAPDEEPDAKPLLESWSGGGLAEWNGLLELTGSRAAAGRVTLSVEAEGPGPVAWAARLEALVRPERAPPRGLALQLSLRQGGPEGPPLPPAGPVAGETAWLVVSLAAADGAGLAGTLLELPLPGGARPLQLPAGAELREGAVRWEVSAERLAIPLLCHDPGDWGIPPARLRSLADPEREAWSAPLRLRIR